MDDPSPQTIRRYLHDLGYGENHLRFTNEFYHRSWMQDDALEAMCHDLRGAYLTWRYQRDPVATLTHLKNTPQVTVVSR